MRSASDKIGADIAANARSGYLKRIAPRTRMYRMRIATATNSSSSPIREPARRALRACSTAFSDIREVALANSRRRKDSSDVQMRPIEANGDLRKALAGAHEDYWSLRLVRQSWSVRFRSTRRFAPRRRIKLSFSDWLKPAVRMRAGGGGPLSRLDANPGATPWTAYAGAARARSS